VTVHSNGDGRFTVGRAVVTVKVDNAATAGALALVQWDIPAGTPGPPVHIHRRATETFYVLEGQVAFIRGTDTIDAGVGEALHIPAGLPPHDDKHRVDSRSGLGTLRPGGAARPDP
jgi:mannose-6-phosphate isomerase-like protein (cupin superfamily)